MFARQLIGVKEGTRYTELIVRKNIFQCGLLDQDSREYTSGTACFPQDYIVRAELASTGDRLCVDIMDIVCEKFARKVLHENEKYENKSICTHYLAQR